MFNYKLVQTKEVDLDSFVEKFKTDDKIINFLNKELGELEYAFLVDCLEKQVQKIKEYTPTPIN